MLFQEVIGQENLKSNLIHTVRENRISHAQLFLGKCGHGGLPLALAYVQYINCLQAGETDACGKCNSCVKIQKLAHPDIHFAFPVSTNKEVKTKATSDDFINQWRSICLEKPYFNLTDWHQKIEIENKQSLINVNESEKIIKKLSLKSYEAKYKTLIIWKAELMHVSAANKLLKLIEEPHPNTIIILISEEKERLLSTIVSRTQILKIPQIESDPMIKYLREQLACSAENAAQISRLSDGDLIEAQLLIQQSEEGNYFFDLFKKWMRSCYEADVEKIHAWVEEVASKNLGREGQKRFLSFSLEIIREGMIKNYGDDRLSKFMEQKDSFIQKFSPFIHENNLLPIISLLEEAHYHISRNMYSKIIFMDISLKFSNLLRVKKRTFVN